MKFFLTLSFLMLGSIVVGDLQASEASDYSNMPEYKRRARERQSNAAKRRNEMDTIYTGSPRRNQMGTIYTGSPRQNRNRQNMDTIRTASPRRNRSMNNYY